MAKKLLFVVVLLLGLSVCAHAWIGVYGCRVEGDFSTAHPLTPAPGFTVSPIPVAVANSSAVSRADGAINSYGMYITSNTSIVGTRTGTFNVSLPTAGYYNVANTYGMVNRAYAKTNAKWVITHAAGSSVTLQDQTDARNMNNWLDLGTYKFNANDIDNTKVMLTNDNQSTSGALYLHSVKFETVTPGAAGYGIEDEAYVSLDELIYSGLTWTAGQYTMAYDVWFGEDPYNLTKLASNYNGLRLGLDPEAVARCKRYFWRLDSINVDKTTHGELMCFYAGFPEPGSMLALGTGLIGLFGIIRRKKS